MSAPATARRSSRPAARTSGRSRARRMQVLRRRLALGAGLALVIVAVLSLVRPADHAVKEITLPLRHEDVIRQQAADKKVDPSLIAGVIYTESRFRDQTSRAGAKGLMQLMPDTADYIARKSGGTKLRARRPGHAADQHRLRHVVSALPARQVQGQHDPRARGLQRGRGQGRRVARQRRRQGREVQGRRPHPVQGDTRLRAPRAERAQRLPQEVRARARPAVATTE